jgi:hypothetical protein
VFYLMVNLISFVEDNPHFVLVAMDGLDRASKFVGDVQFVGVEKQDDSKND